MHVEIPYAVVDKAPEPGSRCPTCDRRVNKPGQKSSPSTKRIVAALPPDRADALSGALDALQAYVGADSESYPRGLLLELLVVLGGQNREELRSYFQRHLTDKLLTEGQEMGIY